MLSKGSERLAADHVALGRLLKELKTALSNDDVAVSYAKVDLFWAKLAVHIRAEHLHLFPDVLKGVTRATMTRCSWRPCCPKRNPLSNDCAPITTFS
jgi:hypothetical protein